MKNNDITKDTGRFQRRYLFSTTQLLAVMTKRVK